MIAVDTSAVVAILLREPDYASFAYRIAQADQCVISTATFVELNVVMSRRWGDRGLHRVREFIARAKFNLSPLTETQARIASEAYHRFPALNFGDCFSYALAKELDVPLLYKGDDFGRTDLRKA